MTLMGAIKQLHDLRSAEDMPIYYKPVIAEVINVLLMDTQEVRHGRWEFTDDAMFGNPFGSYKCSECGNTEPHKTKYCSNCGCKMGVDINGTD